MDNDTLGVSVAAHEKYNRDIYAKKGQKYGNCFFSHSFLFRHVGGLGNSCGDLSEAKGD